MRFVRATAGILLLTIGLPALLVGGALWALMHQRNASGGFAVALERVDTPGHAVVVPDLDALLSRDAPFTRTSPTRLQITAHTSDGPAFVGLAPAADVARYLASAPYATVDRVAVSTGPLPVRVTSVQPPEVPGPRTDALPGPTTPHVIAAPGERSFWVKRGLGALEWAVDDLRGKKLSLVIMHPEAGARVAVNLRAEVHPGWLDPTAWGLLAGGGVLVVLAVALLAWPVRPREVVIVAEPDQVPLPTPPIAESSPNDLGQPNLTAPRARDGASERVAPSGRGAPGRFDTTPAPFDAAWARFDAPPALEAAPDFSAGAPALEAAPAPAASEPALEAAVDAEGPAVLGTPAPAAPTLVMEGPVLPAPPRPAVVPPGAALSQPATEPEAAASVPVTPVDGVAVVDVVTEPEMAAPAEEARGEDDGSVVDAVTADAEMPAGEEVTEAAPAADDGSVVDAVTAEVPPEADVSVADEAPSAEELPEPATRTDAEPALAEPARPEGVPGVLPAVNPAPFRASLSWPPPSPSRATLSPAPIVPARGMRATAGTEGVGRPTSRLKGCRSGSTDVSVPAGNTVPEVEAGNARRRNDAKRDTNS
jgi:hypothetical protein